MDWGLARRARRPEEAGSAPGTAAAPGAKGFRESAALLTQAGVLVHELLSLRHYLEGRESLEDIRAGIETVLLDVEALAEHPSQPRVPAELSWFVLQGFAKNPAERYPSVDAMREELQRIQSGRIQVHCQRTLIKRCLHEALRLVDQHPIAIILGTTAVASLFLAVLVQAVLKLLG